MFCAFFAALLPVASEANNGNVDSAQSGDTKSGTEVEMDGQFHKEEMRLLLYSMLFL